MIRVPFACPRRQSLLGLLTGSGLLLAAVVAGCRPGPGTSENVPDIPVYAGADLVAAAVEEGRDPTETYLVTGASAQVVHGWYVREMRQRGWTPTTAEADEVILYVDPDGCYGLVSVVQDGDDVQLQISQQEAGTPCIRPIRGNPGDD